MRFESVVLKDQNSLNFVMSFQGEPTLFGHIPEKNVYFLIDTSGSMYHQLGFVKKHLIETLTRCATISYDTMFNIIEFKEGATKWADRLVYCTTETVITAMHWINNLTCGTSTNTMTALLQAFGDPATEAVYLVTDGLPDQRPAVILEKLREMPARIPVYCVYLKGTYSDAAACEFLKDLAELTHGSLHAVMFSHQGRIEQRVPIYNFKTMYSKHYDKDESKRYIDLNTPPSPVHASRSYEKPVIPRTNDSSYRDPTLAFSCSKSFDSSVRGYADALIKARGLAQSAGIRCSSTPVASSVMKGVKVLARHDRDGLYYLGHVKEQGPNETFIIKFESCSAMRKTAQQGISVHNIFAYKDATRLDIWLGDKVLAPWQDDGRYGPGTVLDGFERRETRNEGNDDDGGEILVTFFNGQTVSLSRGVAVRIPEKKFERISQDLQLPESQRRKQQLPEGTRCTRSSVYDSYSRPRPKAVWKDERQELENERLKCEIDELIKENSNLLRALDLDHGHATKPRDSPVIGKATSRDLLRDYDSGVFSDEDSWGYSEDDTTTGYNETSLADVGVRSRTCLKEYDLSFKPRFSLPKEKVLLKSGGSTEPTKRWRHTGASAPAAPPPFRETLLKKPREPGDRIDERPTHEEYQTVAGVSFPAGTDRKFGAKRQKWHPYRQFREARGKARENVSAVWERKHLKHSEYQDVSGVKFPSATDKKFRRSLDPNWSPDTALRNAERSRDWEDGLGHGDAEKNARYANKLERIQSNKRRYFKDIEDKVAIEEGKEEKRIEFRRNKATEREEDMAETDAEQERVRTTRMETKREKHAEIVKHEKERTEKALKWKTDRIEALKERQVKFAEIEDGHEIKNDTKKARREAYLRMKESERREDFHDRLREEWRAEDERAERLQRQSEAHREKQSVRRQQADSKKDARMSARRERMEKYRASILP